MKNELSQEKPEIHTKFVDDDGGDDDDYIEVPEDKSETIKLENSPFLYEFALNQ